MQRRGSHKTVECFFSPPDGFLFRRSFCCTLSGARRQWQRCNADGEGHLNKPSGKPGSRDRQAQSNLWLSSPAFPQKGLSSELLDLTNKLILPLLFGSPPYPTFPSFFWMAIYLPPSLYLLSFYPLHPQTSWPVAHPARAAADAQEMLSCISRATCRCFSHQPAADLSLLCAASFN